MDEDQVATDTEEASPAPPDGRRRVLVLGAGMAALAWSQFATGTIDPFDPAIGSFAMPPIAMAILFGIAEAAVVHVQLRRQTLSISLSEIPLVLGLFFLSPVALVASRLIGSSTALFVWRRQPLVKAVYNIGMFSFETCMAVLVFRVALGTAQPFGPSGWAAAQLAGIVGITIGTAAVGVAIQLTEGKTPPDLVKGFVTLGVPTTFVNITLGLLAATLIEFDGRSGLLLLFLSAALFFFYRSHTQLQSNHASLGELYNVTRTVDDALERGGAVRTLLDRTAELMRAEVADLVLEDAEQGSVRWVWHAGTRTLASEPADELAQERNLILGAQSSIMLTGKKDRAALDRLGRYEDAILVGLRGEGMLTGTLMVADRLGNVSTFTDDDRRLFEALGNHASIAMRNSTLLERLRVEIVEREHEALHDRLTGLPNRTMFDREVNRARSAGNDIAVMLIDLDRFKEVNDTLGHQQGDHLLQVVSDRIRDALAEDGIVARFGGDEFAVLLPHCPEGGRSIAVAERIRRGIEQPVDLSGLPIAVGASIGIAHAPEDAHDAESLLQRADVAMYTAKRGTGIERYHPSANHYSPERLAMVAELRKAITRDELLVEYQPCIDLRTGAVKSAEALARWYHPERGYVPPDVFIPIAERSGLIPSLTASIMRTAMRQCSQWRKEGLDVRVAINLSARSLMDDQLPGDIEMQLMLADLPATALVLEITESTIMDDPPRTIAMLNKLSSMGITLSIDDYGTGYSSLAYLKHLPVDELKLDRSFVTDMRNDARDAVIVRNTIELAHELGLRVVAEGIEDAITQRTLADLGCDLAQGYHICRPRTASQFRAFAKGHVPDAPISLDERRRRNIS